MCWNTSAGIEASLQHLFSEWIEGLLPLELLILYLPSREINNILESQIVHNGTVGGVSAEKAHS